MAMEIHIEGEVGGIPRERITTRLTRALARLASRPLVTHVRFADVNGPKGGVDIRCGVVVEVPHQPSVRVESVASTPRLAFDRSCDRLIRHLERARGRWRQDHRHPKKYYVARRLL
ncbi:MAG: HPF/RaiA family ribosome-associated protein [Candidatus Rokubacteria bacterium]|nr:HPF/RaiA family ribosome-associated protein [Candidatus Rokubacteria bacterium]